MAVEPGALYWRALLCPARREGDPRDRREGDHELPVPEGHPGRGRPRDLRRTASGDAVRRRRRDRERRRRGQHVHLGFRGDAGAGGRGAASEARRDVHRGGDAAGRSELHGRLQPQAGCEVRQRTGARRGRRHLGDLAERDARHRHDERRAVGRREGAAHDLVRQRRDPQRVGLPRIPDERPGDAGDRDVPGRHARRAPLLQRAARGRGEEAGDRVEGRALDGRLAGGELAHRIARLVAVGLGRDARADRRGSPSDRSRRRSTRSPVSCTRSNRPAATSR